MTRGNFRVNGRCVFCGSRGGPFLKRGQKYQPIFLCSDCTEQYDKAQENTAAARTPDSTKEPG